MDQIVQFAWRKNFSIRIRRSLSKVLKYGAAKLFLKIVAAFKYFVLRVKEF